MARVFLSYRHVEPDATVAARLNEHLLRHHHGVFFDLEKLRMADRWHPKIQRELDAAEYFIALVSLSYLNSPYILDHELRRAAQRLRAGTLKGLLHINLAFDGKPPAEVADVLRDVQHFKWRSDEDTKALLEAVSRVLPSPQPLVRGAQGFDATDARLFAALGRRDAIDELVALIRAHERPHVLAHGASGVGKSSFLRAGVQPALGAAMVVVELSEGSAEELRMAAEPDAVVAFDQFEQVLVKLARDRERLTEFAVAAEELTREGRRFLFCVRTDHRDRFEELLPHLHRQCLSFRVHAFAPAEAAVVLEVLLEDAHVGYDRDALVPFCEALADGVPPVILPVILQMVVQHCRDRDVELTEATRHALMRKDTRSFFADHLHTSVVRQLPRSVPELDGALTLRALTNGDVKSPPKTVADIAEEEQLKAAHVHRTLQTAAGPGARVVTIEAPVDPNDPARYRLAHDLFVPPVQQLHERAARVRRWRNRGWAAVVVVLVALAALAAYRAVDPNAPLRAEQALDKAIAEQQRPEAAALYAAQAAATAMQRTRDPRRAAYALASMHASLAIAPPIVLPRESYDEPHIIASEFVELSGKNRETFVHLPAGGAPLRLRPRRTAGPFAISSDGHWIAATFIGEDERERPMILRRDSGEAVPWERAPEYAPPVVFNSDASLLISHNYEGFFSDRRLHVWDRATGRLLRAIPLRGVELPVLFLRSGHERVLTAHDGEVEITDVRTGAKRALKLVPGPTTARFSGDGLKIVTGASDGTLTSWDASTLQRVATATVGRRTMTRIEDVSTDGSKVLGSTEDEQVFLWDTKSGRVDHTSIPGFDFHYGGTGSPEQRLRFTAGERAFVSVGGGSVVLPRDGASENPAHAPPGPFVVRTWTADGAFRQWGPVVRLPNNVSQLVISDDGATLRAALADRRVLQWDLRRRIEVIAQLPALPEHMVAAADFTSDLAFAAVSYRRTGTGPFATAVRRLVDVHKGVFADAGFHHEAPFLKLLHDRFAVRSWFVREEMQSGNPTRVQVLELRTGRIVPAAQLETRVSLHDVAMPVSGNAVRTLGRGFNRDGRMRVIDHSLRDGTRSEPRYLPGLASDDFRTFLDDAGTVASDIDVLPERLTFRFLETASDWRSSVEFQASASRLDPHVLGALFRGGAQVTLEEPGQVVVTARSGAKFRIVRRGDDVAITDAITGEARIFPRSDRHEFDEAAFSRDGRLALVTEQNGVDDVVQVWDLSLGRPVTQPLEMASGIASATFTHGDRAAAVLGRDGVLRRIPIGDRAPYAPSWKPFVKTGAWLTDLAAYCSGTRLDGDVTVPLTQEQHAEVRRRLTAALREAAAHDPNARQVMERLGLK